MKTAILTCGGFNVAPSTSGVRFLSVASSRLNGGWVSTEGDVEYLVTEAGTISDLVVDAAQALGATQSMTIRLRLNGADTALLAQVTNASTLAVDHDPAHAVAVVPGDRICWKNTPLNTPTTQTGGLAVAAVFTSTAAGKGMLFAGHGSGQAAQYLQMGTTVGAAGTSTDCTARMPCAGSIGKMRGRLTAAPGGATARSYTVHKNGSPTTLTLSFDAADTLEILDLGGSRVSFAAGDTIAVSGGVTGTPAAASAMLSFDWQPDVDGESPAFNGLPGTVGASDERYMNFNGRSANSTSTTGSRNVAPVALSVDRFYGRVDTAPGSGNSRAFTLRKNGSAQALTFTIDGAELDDEDTDAGHAVAFAAHDFLDIATNPTSTPDPPVAIVTSAVVYIAAAAGGSRLTLTGVGR